MTPVTTLLRKRLLKWLEQHRYPYEQRGYNNLGRLYRVIRPGDVVLVEGRSEMSRLIKLFSGSSWSHAALYVGDALAEFGTPAQKRHLNRYGKDARHMLVEAFSGKGVIASPISIYEDYNIRICRPYGILDTDLEQVIRQVIGKIGMNYDDQNILEIALMALQAIWRPVNRLSLKACLGNCNDFQVICSGMIAQAFQTVGYPIVPTMLPRKTTRDRLDAYSAANPYGGGLIMRHYTQISPKDFDLSPNFEIIKYNIVGTDDFDYKSIWSQEKFNGGE